MNEINIKGKNFYLFLKVYRVDLSEIKKGLSINNPEKIMGFAGASLGLPDVYISEELYEKTLLAPYVCDELQAVLNNIAREDYGIMSEDEKQYNSEQRWIAGSYYDVIARFDISCGRVEFTGYDGYALIQLIETD